MLPRKFVFIALFASIFFGAQYDAVAAEKSLPEPKLGEDGLYVQPWFKDSFLELADDLQEAADEDKRLVIFWEEKGCQYCRRMHKTNLRNRQIVDYISKHFDVIQLNMKGSRDVMGFDGKTMTERKFSRKTVISGTPTIQFIVKNPSAANGKSSRAATAWRFTGYLPKEQFLNAFVYAQTEAYKGKRDFINWYRNSGDTVKLRK